MVLVFGMMIVGCEQEKDPTYYYEGFEITMAQYNSFMSTTTPGYTYTNSQIKRFRQTLRNYNGTFIASGEGVTESELRDLFIQTGMSPSEYTELKASLDSVGNLIYFFSQNYSSNIIWIYFEKG